MHMNYADYAGYKHGSGTEAVRKEARQRELFRRAEKHFAVGPLLRSAMGNMVDGDVTMLVPGFANVRPCPAKHRLTVITFGRMDRESDRIKQGGLAVAGFAAAVRQASEIRGMPHLLHDEPQMRVIGISEEMGLEEQALRRLAHEKAGGQIINLLAQPFAEDRDQLFDQLGRANIALMLSWHEGFGLTGWEAIAAEVPLVVSRRSGLYRLVHKGLEGIGDNCLRVIDVQGREGDDETSNFTEKDEAAARDAILDITSELPSAQRRAKHLKKLLQDKLVCTWENTARQFCEALQLEPKPSTVSGPTVAPPPDCGDATLPQPSPGPEPTRADSAPETSPPPLIALPQPPWSDDFMILSANSGCQCQSGEACDACLGAWPTVEPVHDP
jgi:glycosyltransferase involved in cell wall biosynthesis